ncbi:hypothetical protein LPA81_23700 (plasmid) [Salmonella enterica subsp. enterica]|uniref:hypothetical protein n=1 Tax=Salmonella enterica TaxID=28901 RepID=UPI003529D871
MANAISSIGRNKNERKIPQMKGKNGSTTEQQAQKTRLVIGLFVYSNLELVALTGEGYSTPNVYILFTMVL